MTEIILFYCSKLSTTFRETEISVTESVYHSSIFPFQIALSTLILTGSTLCCH